MKSQILQFLKLYHETTIPKVYFDQIFFFQKSKLKKTSFHMRFTNPANSVKWIEIGEFDVKLIKTSLSATGTGKKV
jgi:hypothetical protein